MNTSSSARVSDRFAEISIELVEPHPLNANVMSAEMFVKLKTHISNNNDYPPLIVRPLEGQDTYQVLDGHHRLEILRELGHETVRCYIWPCDDAQALILLATLNRLEGTDVPALRASLMQELSSVVDVESLELLLPESSDEISDLLDLESIDEAAVLASLTIAAEPSGTGVSAISFAVDVEQASIIERAILIASENLTGNNRRGRALSAICSAYLEVIDA